jgi:superfamily II DNA or RNA helicase
MSDYGSFIHTKHRDFSGSGIAPESTGSHLFEHQRLLVEWALRKGRSAIFADTGLGKTAIELEWARQVAAHGRVLILTPLAVAAQTTREAKRFGVDVSNARQDDGARIVVTNYDNMHNFDASLFTGVVLDESSILKNFTGAMRNSLIASFSSTPYRLACTATPAPNDHTELGNHAEFLGVRTRVEMLAEYFVHDGGSTKDWRLKGHAVDPFWDWVGSWGAVLRSPADLGIDAAGFALPPLRMTEHIIAADHTQAFSQGRLFADVASSLNEQRGLRRDTLAERVDACSKLATGKSQCLIWCELNDEADAIVAAIPGAVQVAGSDDPEVKTERLLGFADGSIRVLVTKPKIAGFGMNWQRCQRMVFAGASHSFEQTYQAIRRCWRFGQTKPVDVTIVRHELDGPIVDNYRRKEAEAARMQSEMVGRTATALRAELLGKTDRWVGYNPQQQMNLPRWVEPRIEENAA